MLRKRPGKHLLASVTALALLSGCTYESAPKEFVKLETEQPGKTPEKNPAQVLQTALSKAKTDPEAQKFWFSGYVKNRMMSRELTSMFDGIVADSDSYQVTGRIAAQEFVYYRNNDDKYIYRGGSWITAREESIPVDVFKGFDDWIPFLDRAVEMPEEKVISTMTTPYQIKITGKEWVENSNIDLFKPLQDELAGRPDLDKILENTTIKTTFGIGQKDGLIHSYQTWIIVPVPGAGYMDQEVNFKFFKYGENLQLTPMTEVEKYLLD
ncbi:hypothetical protein [Brevibacillus daliensis]|uniref:hypothetical protein n=1 Tax=Brevibacillus daliensis TaxID=2892995 RepID=UPI001E60D437|nr:hypothetical protein [Brevibacillus daliensis]